MERIPAFRPKTEDKGEISEQENIKKPDSPLKSIEEDKSQISSFNFVLEYVLEGRVTTEKQLRAFVNPKFKGDKNELAVESGEYSDIKNKKNLYLTKEDLGNRKLSEEQVSVLLDILKEAQSALKEDRKSTRLNSSH